MEKEEAVKQLKEIGMPDYDIEEIVQGVSKSKLDKVVIHFKVKFGAIEPPAITQEEFVKEAKSFGLTKEDIEFSLKNGDVKSWSSYIVDRYCRYVPRSYYCHGNPPLLIGAS
jgi:hypothetical protein